MSTIAKPLTTIRTLTAAERSALKKAGIDDTAELLAAAKTPKDEKALAKRAGVSVTSVREAVNRADLMRVGLGAARADLFENAGINSAAELAQRNAASLRGVLERFAKANPELDVHLPSPKTIASLIAKAKELDAPAPAGPIDDAAAGAIAATALHAHIDDVLFSSDPAGKSFRDAVLAWRPAAEWPNVQKAMHEDVANFVQTAERSKDPADGSVVLSGRLFQLYTEVKLDSAGKVLRTYVEID
ncbi:MAG: DUF4332 domain-containing protein [Deltaproteobacteria bacterium]|nr:DUF4332 domain-containing protein [Deltaproteobacteria bacterium]